MAHCWRWLFPSQSARPGRIRAVVAALGHVNTVVILGIVVFLLSDVLRYIVEQELGG